MAREGARRTFPTTASSALLVDSPAVRPRQRDRRRRRRPAARRCVTNRRRRPTDPVPTGARQVNRLASQSSTRAYEVRAVFDRRSTAVDDGVVAFEMSDAWEEAAGSRTVSADDTVAVTYFVPRRTVIRREGTTGAGPREPGVGEVVVRCVGG